MSGVTSAFYTDGVVMPGPDGVPDTDQTLVGNTSGGLTPAYSRPATHANVLNTLSSTYSRLRVGKANVRRGIADCVIPFLGDSTSLGYGGLNEGNAPYRDGSPTALSAMFTAGGLPSALGFIIPQVTSVPEPRITLGSGWVIRNFGACNQACCQSSTPTTASLTFTPGVVADTYDLLFIQSNAASANIKINVTGASEVVFSAFSNTTNGIVRATIVAPAASVNNVVTISATVSFGSIWCLGCQPSLSTKKQILIANCGLPGKTATEWLNGGLSYSNGLSLLSALNPAMTVISLGINDAGASTTADAFYATMSSIVSYAVARSDVLLIVPPPQANSTVQALLLQYRQKYYQLSKTYNVPLLDWQRRMDFVNNPTFTGNVHPNNTGYQDIAQAIYSIFRDV